MWPYYHLVHNLGHGPGIATAILFSSGGLGLVGFRYGGVLSDRLGRRTTLAAGASLSTLLMTLFYLLPASIASVWALGALFGSAAMLGNASIVAVRSSSTELFPTRLRSTVNGWGAAAGAFAAVAANFATALLADRLGGLVPAIACLAFFIVPACVGARTDSGGSRRIHRARFEPRRPRAAARVRIDSPA
jgi:MFS family permease